MNSTRRLRTGTIVVGGALAAVVIAGCGTSTANTAATPSSPSPSTADAAAPTGQFTTVQSPASQADAAPTRAAIPVAARTPECTARTLSLSFGAGDAGMSQQERVLRFTNKGSTTCAIVGFPGVSYVTGDDGRQVGAPAVRTGKIGAQVSLAPGAVASTIVHSVDPGVFDPSACKPTPVRGLRIYAPDDTAAMFIAYPSGVQGCAGATPDPQLSVVTITAGPGTLS